MSPFSALPPNPEFKTGVLASPGTSSRRNFLRQLLGAGTIALSGLETLEAQTTGNLKPEAFRFAFITDLHLLGDDHRRSAEGIAACLDVVEKLDPRPDFIVVGGDLVHDALSIPMVDAEKGLDRFLEIWHGHTSLPSYWVLGNHDLAAVKESFVPAFDPHFGTKLFQERLPMPQIFYSFDFKGWHFVVLDDVTLLPSRDYTGELPTDQLAFLRADLQAHANAPTLVCAHIPLVSALPLTLLLNNSSDLIASHKGKIICSNSGAVIETFAGRNVRAVLSGHLHHYETTTIDGVRFINSGAVCGNYWRGPMFGCPEGFGVVDLSADGTVDFRYHDYGWKA